MGHISKGARRRRNVSARATGYGPGMMTATDFARLTAAEEAFKQARDQGAPEADDLARAYRDLAQAIHGRLRDERAARGRP